MRTFCLLLWCASALAASPPVAKIAVVGPLSGSSAAYGESQLRGATLALEQLTAVGGMPVTLRLVAVDDGGESGRVGALARDLLFEDGVVAFLGCVNSACTHVLEMICVKAQRPQITCVSTDPSVTRAGSPWIFRCLADDVKQAEAIARHLIDVLHAERVAVLTLDDRYGQMGSRTLRQTLEAAGRPPAFVSTFGSGDGERNTLAERVARQRPDAVVVWSLFREGARVVRALREAGVSCPVIGPDGLATPAFIDEAAEAAEGVIVTQPFDPERPSPRTHDFLAAYRRRWGTEPDSFAAHAFDGMSILASAIRRAGTEAFALRAALASTAAFEGVTGLVTFDATGNDTRTVSLAVVRDGRFVALRKLLHSTGR